MYGLAGITQSRVGMNSVRIFVPARLKLMRYLRTASNRTARHAHSIFKKSNNIIFRGFLSIWICTSLDA